MKRSRQSSPSPNVVIGLAWYELDQWQKLKQVAADAEALDDTYEEWQQGIESTERDLKGRGLFVRRVPIDVDALATWCKLQKRSLNGSARAEYTAEANRLMK